MVQQQQYIMVQQRHPQQVHQQRVPHNSHIVGDIRRAVPVRIQRPPVPPQQLQYPQQQQQQQLQQIQYQQQQNHQLVQAQQIPGQQQVVSSVAQQQHQQQQQPGGPKIFVIQRGNLGSNVRFNKQNIQVVRGQVIPPGQVQSQVQTQVQIPVKHPVVQHQGQPTR
jgi:hypothetical protein